KRPLATGPGHRLRTNGLQVHFDARLGFAVEGHVAPALGREVTAQQTVDVPQQVAVEGRCDAQGVVVGQVQHRLVLDAVDTDQQAGTRTATLTQGTRLPQQPQGLIGREIADAGARVEHAARCGLQ
ncbi:hypothetical protein RZS08_50790, partial [Arthrospira platensis SPKY1]|nr:hypothetical protein [Arthrospira platensis SPKY1]